MNKTRCLAHVVLECNAVVKIQSASAIAVLNHSTEYCGMLCFSSVRVLQKLDHLEEIKYDKVLVNF